MDIETKELRWRDMGSPAYVYNYNYMKTLTLETNPPLACEGLWKSVGGTCSAVPQLAACWGELHAQKSPSHARWRGGTSHARFSPGGLRLLHGSCWREVVTVSWAAALQSAVAAAMQCMEG